MTRTPQCPGCGREDRLQAVPAVYLGGRDTVRVRVRHADDHHDRTVDRPVTTALSEALAPVPDPPSRAIGCLGVLALLVAVGTFVAGAGAGHWLDDVPVAEGGGVFDENGIFHAPGQELPAAGPGWPDFAWLAVISAVALTAAVLVLVLRIRSHRAFTRLTSGRSQAERLWSRAWYCHRCGSVHFRDVPGEDTRPLTFQEFRERVWQEGGYGDLAATQRALGPTRSA